MVSRDYTVSLEQVFNGPMDLLLHLVREQEVEIHEINLQKVIEGYLGYLKALEEIDIELAADFLVMAATLMAIKSRSLLPSETIDLAEELDPRDELIQRLIEYRHFKQASRELQDRFDLRSKIHERGYRPATDADGGLDLGEVTNWDLFAAFSRLMRETLAHKSIVIATEDRPLRFYVEQLVRTVKARRSMSLRELVDDAVEQGGATKGTMIGAFCALLELVKLGAVRARQETKQADIVISLREDLGDDLDSIVRQTEFEDERIEDPDAPAAASSEPQPPAPPKASVFEGLDDDEDESDYELPRIAAVEQPSEADERGHTLAEELDGEPEKA
ncbi:MAG: segregation/condensation protein A [Planctomycetaceae bacterium]|jgi:segregation and condensation protein A|nr:segregation/condensation protein A [Planctomycetaceae bacterium]